MPLRSNEGASRHVNKNGEIKKRASVRPPDWFLDYKTPKNCAVVIGMAKKMHLLFG